MKLFFSKFSGYLAGAGLLGKALWEISTGNYAGAWADAALGLAVFGIHFNTNGPAK